MLPPMCLESCCRGVVEPTPPTGGRFDGVGPQVIEGRALQLTMDQLSGLGTGYAPRDRVVRQAAVA
jgi:hypothetical protein